NKGFNNVSWVIHGSNKTAEINDNSARRNNYASKENATVSVRPYLNITYADEGAIPPNINITYPLNITYSSIVRRLNYTTGDNIELDTCWYSLDLGVTNTTITCGTNATSLNSGIGSSTWFVWSNDTNNNVNSSSVTFYVNGLGVTSEFKLDENQGSITYDNESSFDGTIYGASWSDDAINIALTRNVEYQWYSNGIWELLDSGLDRTGMNVSYSTSVTETTNFVQPITSNASLGIVGFFSNVGTWFNILAVVIIIIIIGTVIAVVSKFGSDAENPM
ncbi:unnamed protein product, partial [marine sediment metagenome]